MVQELNKIETHIEVLSYSRTWNNLIKSAKGRRQDDDKTYPIACNRFSQQVSVSFTLKNFTDHFVGLKPSALAFMLLGGLNAATSGLNVDAVEGALGTNTLVVPGEKTMLVVDKPFFGSMIAGGCC